MMATIENKNHTHHLDNEHSGKISNHLLHKIIEVKASTIKKAFPHN